MALFTTNKATTRTRVHHSASHVITSWLAIRYEVAVSPIDLAEFLVSIVPPPNRRDIEVSDLTTAWNSVKPSLPMLFGPTLMDITLAQQTLGYAELEWFFKQVGRGPSLLVILKEEHMMVTGIDFVDTEILVFDSCRQCYRRINEELFEMAYVLMPKITKAYLKRGNRPSKNMVPPAEIAQDVDRWPALSAGLSVAQDEASGSADALALVPVAPESKKRRKGADAAPAGPPPAAKSRRTTKGPELPALTAGPSHSPAPKGGLCVYCGCDFRNEPRSIGARLPERRPYMAYASSASDETGYPVCHRCYRTKVNVNVCAGCGEERTTVSRCQQRADWMLPSATSTDGGFPICNGCYRKHVNSATCAGCGEWKHVIARVPEEEPWMQACSSSKGYRDHYGVCHFCYQKFMGHATCSGCGKKKLVCSRVLEKESWMRGVNGTDGATSYDGGYAVCVQCYRNQLTSAPCAGCGKEKPTVARLPRKEAWMKSAAAGSSREGHAVCHNCYRRHAYLTSCACCGKEKAVAVTLRKKYEWMRADAERSEGGYATCAQCCKENLEFWHGKVEE